MPFDFIGGAQMIATLRRNGDAVSAWGTAGFVQITLDRPWFSGASRTSGLATVQLQNKAETVAVTDPFDGTFRDRFRHSSDELATPAPGDRLIADVAPDADWIVPQVDASVGVNSDVVSGRCYDTGSSARLVQVLLHRSGKERGWALLDTEADGSFSFDFQTDGDAFWTNADVRDGDRISVRCMQAEGDWVQRVVFAG